ncbi:unnamed protein product, partial [Mesorhabditis belari]|uniref:Uncharacterized protein n=1 Tax=Mesorhabditis belari TaxID=2138241 RepID=A0AAF3EPK2_9BILA
MKLFYTISLLFIDALARPVPEKRDEEVLSIVPVLEMIFPESAEAPLLETIMAIDGAETMDFDALLLKEKKTKDLEKVFRELKIKNPNLHKKLEPHFLKLKANFDSLKGERKEWMTKYLTYIWDNLCAAAVSGKKEIILRKEGDLLKTKYDGLSIEAKKSLTEKFPMLTYFIEHEAYKLEE